jgi:hypothetical protein
LLVVLVVIGKMLLPSQPNWTQPWSKWNRIDYATGRIGVTCGHLAFNYRRSFPKLG